MSCAISKGRSLPCKDSVGGLKAVYIVDYSTDVAGEDITDGEISIPASITDWGKFDIKGNSSLETTISSSRENGTTFFESALNLTFTYLDHETQAEIAKIAKARPHVVVEDYNGNYLLLGHEHGCEVTGGTTVTGAAMGDLSGFTLVLTAQEVAPPPFSGLPDSSGSTQINPETA